MDDNIIRFPGFLITADRNGCWTEVLSGALLRPRKQEAGAVAS